MKSTQQTMNKKLDIERLAFQASMIYIANKLDVAKEELSFYLDNDQVEIVVDNLLNLIANLAKEQNKLLFSLEDFTKYTVCGQLKCVKFTLKKVLSILFCEGIETEILLGSREDLYQPLVYTWRTNQGFTYINYYIPDPEELKALGTVDKTSKFSFNTTLYSPCKLIDAYDNVKTIFNSPEIQLINQGIISLEKLINSIKTLIKGEEELYIDKGELLKVNIVYKLPPIWASSEVEIDDHLYKTDNLITLINNRLYLLEDINNYCLLLLAIEWNSNTINQANRAYKALIE